MVGGEFPCAVSGSQSGGWPNGEGGEVPGISWRDLCACMLVVEKGGE